MPEPRPRIRHAEPGDVGELVALINAAYGRTEEVPGWTSEQDLITGPRVDQGELSELIERPDSHLLLAEVDGRLAGCVHLEAAGQGACELGLLSIHPELQEEGLGRHLLEAAEAHARDELEAERVRMHVVSVREELIAWYQRRGYEPTGERVPLELDGDQRSLAGPLTFEILVKRWT